MSSDNANGPENREVWLREVLHNSYGLHDLEVDADAIKAINEGASELAGELTKEDIAEIEAKPDGPCTLCGGPHPTALHGYWVSKWTSHQSDNIVDDNLGFDDGP